MSLTSAPPRSRIAGLEGIRGLAAVFVVVNHIFLRTFPGYPVDNAPVWAGWFIYGRFAVVVFIVLSGFSLALSPARHGWRLGSISRFAYRRARRILPAYWAALAFSLAVAWLVVPPPGQGLPTTSSVVVNGLLVQNIVGAPTPNPSFWSLAVEAQLYVLFPLLLLMVRRFGAIVMVATVTLVVAAIGIVGPHVSRLDTFVIQSAPDLAALFAVGILAAGIVGASRARGSWPWAWLALAFAAPVFATIWWRGSVWTLDHLFWVDLALGPALACLLAGLATGRPARLVRMLDSRPIRGLGSSSYSLYLIHGPIVVVVYEEFVAGTFRHGVLAFVITVALAVPLSIAVARLFAAVFEPPFRRRTWSWPFRRHRAARLVAAIGCALVLALTGCSRSSDTRAAAPPAAGSTYTLMQMNLCLSGLAGCYSKVAYPAVLQEAVARIHDAHPDAVTFNEACSGDIARIARRTGYRLRFSRVIYLGSPQACLRPSGRGLFGDAVLTKAAVRSTDSRPFDAQAGVEQRRWLCVTTRVDVDVCTAHLASSEADEVAANDPQCTELGALLARRAAAGTVIFAGDVNRRSSCAPAGFWTRTDASAEQDPGRQQVYGTGALRSPSGQVVPARHSDHDTLLVRAHVTTQP